jgi:putative FmdB family regulatory protein
MPLYSYKCEDESCKHEFDEIVPLSELYTKEVICPKCGKVSKREVTTPRVVHSTCRNWRL